MRTHPLCPQTAAWLAFSWLNGFGTWQCNVWQGRCDKAEEEPKVGICTLLVECDFALEVFQKKVFVSCIPNFVRRTPASRKPCFRTLVLIYIYIYIYAIQTLKMQEIQNFYMVAVSASQFQSELMPVWGSFQAVKGFLGLGFKFFGLGLRISPN